MSSISHNPVAADASASVRVDNVSKKYCRSLKRSILYGMKDLASAAIGHAFQNDHLRQGEFWALKDLSFQLKPGECLGVIGRNGAGKSTLLKLLNGIIEPDRGRIEMRGRVGALIEVGAGFHPLLTGRENIYVNGAILGMSTEEIDRKRDAIIEYAGLPADALDAPVKTYSSGMYVRLGFAIAAHIDPDILLIDEVLAVGDAAFHSQCYSTLSRLLGKGVSVVVISHDLVAVQQLTTRCLYMNQGAVGAFGPSLDVIQHYRQDTDAAMVEQSRAKQPSAPPSVQGGRFTELELMDQSGKPSREFRTGEPASMRFRIELQPGMDAVHLSFGIHSPDWVLHTTYFTAYQGFQVHPVEGHALVEFHFPQLLLGTGIYLINVGLWDKSGLGSFDWRWDAISFKVTNDQPMAGRFMLPHEWRALEGRIEPCSSAVEAGEVV